jgi:hypothetical protein
MKALFLVLLCGLLGLGAEQPVRELSTQAVPSAHSIVPLFRHGYLILFPPGGAPGASLSMIKYGFTAYSPDGNLAYQKTLQVPGGSQPVVRDVDFDADGNAAVATSAEGGPSGFLSGILLLDHTGGDTGFINTDRYVPARIAIAPDSSIWALGWQHDAQSARPDRQGYMIVRHFSADGKELKAHLPRSSFPPGLEPGADGPEVHIEVTNDRVGILAFSGETGATAEWVELDLNGNLLGRYRTDDAPLALALAAFTADDHVYLAGPKFGELYTLDHASHNWKLTPQQVAGMLMGADGNSLVYKVGKNVGPILLQWFNQPQS